MSEQSIVSLQCPECSTPDEAPVLTSLNATVDPQLRDDFFAGKINAFTCKKCGFQAHLPVRLLYHDMERQFCAQFYPPQELDDTDLTRIFTSQGRFSVDLPADLARVMPSYMKEVHVVFSLRELAEYVSFRERLAEEYAAQRL